MELRDIWNEKYISLSWGESLNATIFKKGVRNGCTIRYEIS